MPRNNCQNHLKTTIPFVKNNEFELCQIYCHGLSDDSAVKYGWLIFIPMVILVVTAVSNGANITDGIDGLSSRYKRHYRHNVLGIFAYVSGNMVFADYLNIMYIPYSR